MRKTIYADFDGRPIRTPQTGATRSHLIFTDEDWAAGIIPFRTGPLIDGIVRLPTGTEYDVSEMHIAVPVEHIKALQRAIHVEHHRRGRFLDIPLPAEEG